MLTNLVDPLISLAEKEGEELIPFRPKTLELVYGNMDYVRSVFGDVKVTRMSLMEYYQNARRTWYKCDYPNQSNRSLVTKWCRELSIKPLHYYTPIGEGTIWFKEAEDAFAFKLKFGDN